MPDSRVTLTVGGKSFTGWESVRIRHSIDTLVGGFELSLGWVDDGGDSVPEARAGASCKVSIDGEEVLRGYVDVAQRGIDDGSRSLQVLGRGAAMDLIDCSSPLENKTLRDLSLDKLVAQLVQPFGLGVRVASGVDLGKPFGQFTLQAAETPWEAMERACRSRMVLPSSDVDGTIVLTRPGAGGQTDPLVYGQNILSARRLSDMSGRYSEIKVRGESQFDLGGEIQQPVGVEGLARDAGVSRYRPKVLVTSGLTEEYVRQRAAWEAVVRAAKADRFEVAVKGFRMSNGALWQPNMRAGVKVGPLNIDTTLLVASRVFSQAGDSGTRTTLELVRPDAYTYRPEVPEQTLFDPEGSTMNDTLTRLVTKLRGMVGRAVIRAIDDTTPHQQVRIAYPDKSVRERVERLGSYGFASHPKVGAEAVVVQAAGREVVIAVEDRRYRLKGLEAGEVALYDDLGSKVHLKRGGVIHVSAETVLLGANAGAGDGVLTGKTLNPVTGLPFGEGVGLGSTTVRAEA